MLKSEENKGSSFTCVIPFKIPLSQKEDEKESKNLVNPPKQKTIRKIY